MWQTLAATRSCANARALPAHTLAPIVTRRAGIHAGELGWAAARQRRRSALASRDGVVAALPDGIAMCQEQWVCKPRDGKDGNCGNR